MPNQYFVYIMGNAYGTLYTGVTNNLERRVDEHKRGAVKGFTKKYKINRLLYFEEFDNIDEACATEKVVKGWLRKKKLDLIRRLNPKFIDLSEDWSSAD